ncbi:Methionine aminopeptidase 1 [Bachmanniomyces sp. S44760]|nr:Methionine aminopeptidase 1 [Bachmanniomyces sp. S44760]
MPAMATDEASKRKCIGVDCPNDAGSLQCPTCLKLGKEGFFCSQDCFKTSWTEHKAVHKSSTSQSLYNPFPTFPFTGSMRPVYPLSPRRQVPESIQRPDYAEDGIPRSEHKFFRRHEITVLDRKGQEGMKKACRLTREVLDTVANEVRPGVTTDFLDEVVHKACIERNSYPSPLNYNHFPKSFCTSVNEIICHGIPDQRVLLDGDIINLDISLYHGGYHGDLNETYYVGEKAKADPDSVRVVEAAREALDEAIRIVKPGMLFREPGGVIEKYVKTKGCTAVKTYCGHGINTLFHCPPNVPHYAKNKAVGTAKPGMTFTIEPMICLGSYRDKTWPDNWTSTTTDGLRTAQFEHTLLVTEAGVEILTARTADSPGGPVPMPEARQTENDLKMGQEVKA